MLLLPRRCCVCKSPHSPVEETKACLRCGHIRRNCVKQFCSSCYGALAHYDNNDQSTSNSINSCHGGSQRCRHSPCVSVLVSDLLLHLCVCQRLQQGAPLVSVTRVSNGDLHRGQRVLTAQQQICFSLVVLLAESEAELSAQMNITSSFLPESVRPLVPAQLTPDAVGDGGDELPAQAELGAQLQGKLLWRVLPLRHVPLELVHQRDVPDMDVQLEETNRFRNTPSYRRPV